MCSGPGMGSRRCGNNRGFPILSGLLSNCFTDLARDDLGSERWYGIAKHALDIVASAVKL